MAAVGTVDQAAPVFFLSYARPNSARASGPLERDRFVSRFFLDLSEEVAQLVSIRTGADPGYMNQSVRGGVDWRTEVLNAVGTCQTFVALLSGPYATSSWCGMEWDAFSRRRIVVSREYSNRQSAIVPVTWAPFPQERAPAPIRAIQRFSPETSASASIDVYYRAGIYGLMREGHEDLYSILVWQLAKHIAKLYYSLSVEPLSLKPDELRDIFAERSQ
jgi:hypothetical protein